MKLELPNNVLLPAVSSLKGIVQPSHTLPSLSYFLFRQEGDNVTVAAAGNDIEMIYSLPGVTMAEKGDGLIPAAKLELISANSEENDVISLNCGENQVVVTCPRSHFKLASLPADQFPQMEDVADEGTQIDVRADDLRLLLEKTSFSMAQDDARYYLNGMLLANDEGHLLAVATDGHRLAVCRHGHESKAGQTNVILPRQAVNELKRLLPQTEEMVSITVGEKHVRVRFGVITMTMKLLEGSKYPDYKRVMPSDFAHVISLDSEVLRRTLAKTQVVDEAAIRLCFDKNMMKVISKSDLDEAEVEQEIEYDGQPFEVGFNSVYLRDVLGAVGSERVLFEFKDPNSAVQIRESESEAAKYVVMPLRL